MAFIDRTPEPGYKLDLPLFVGGKTRQLKDGSWTKPTKRFWLTQNNYRNWHYQTANNTKRLFKEAVSAQIIPLPDLLVLWGAITLNYRLFPPDARNRDLTNSVSVVDKYFADALVELGKLPDDNFNFIKGVSSEFVAIDKANPRMEVVIRPYSPR